MVSDGQGPMGEQGEGRFVHGGPTLGRLVPRWVVFFLSISKQASTTLVRFSLAAVLLTHDSRDLRPEPA